MNRFFKWNRFLSICMAVVMVISLTACASRGKEETPPGEPPAKVEIPQYINPLPFLGLNNRPKTEAKPDEELLKKINDAYNKNNDTVGWLKMPNTSIDESVVQAKDNEYYLRRNVSKTYDWYGCYFADSDIKSFGDRNKMPQNTIIYGHSMDDNPDGLKFSQLKKLLDPEFAKNNPYIHFATPEDDMVWQIFSVMYTDTNLGYIYPDMQTAEYQALLDEARLRSSMIYDVPVTTNDKILTLSTCTYINGSKRNLRFVVMAKLVPQGEKLNPTVSVQKNPNPKAPQL